MKTLTVLVNALCSRFAKSLVEYLIDCGHFIDVIECEDSLIWQTISNYNLRLVSKEHLDESIYDFVLCFDELANYAFIPRLVFDVHSGMINIELMHKDRYLNLSTGSLHGEIGNCLDEELPVFFTNVLGYFIDAVVSLMRLKPSEIRYKKKSKVSGKAFLAYLELDNQLQSLEQYYKTTEASESKFHLPAILSLDCHYQCIDYKTFKWSQAELELFIMYLLILFNGRQPGLYAYDTQTHERRISKYIDFSFETSLSQLFKLVDAPEYAIFHHALYGYHGLHAYKTNVLVNYGAPFKSNSDFILQLGIDFDKNVLWINYPKELYFFEYIERFAHDFCNSFSRRLQKNTFFYDVLYHDNTAYEKQLHTWNQIDCSKKNTLPKLLTDQANKTPNHIALVFENQTMTYQELDRRSNQMARYILKNNPSELVALYFDRSLEMIVAILGVIKAGYAYVPIDTSSPNERIEYMLTDTQSTLLLTQSSLEASLYSVIPKSTKLLSIDGNAYGMEDNQRLKINIKPTDLAYVIYTSGTTGLPKGVMIEHGSVCNTILGQYERLKVNEKSRVLQYASIAFDTSVEEIFTPLISGASLFIINESQRRDGALLTHFLQDHKINLAIFTPAIAQVIEWGKLKNLKKLIIAGDVCDAHSISKWMSKRELINEYGPTEATVCSATHVFSLTDKPTIIGKPITNTKLYILDPNNNPLPVGAIGELCIGGAGLARGYLNQEQLTQERFISNPFTTEEDRIQGYTRLYKTGDLVRYLPDGNIEYIGRNDFQVKIRGFRVELGEIEKVLAQYPGILQCVVLSYQEPHPYIAAFYLSSTTLNENLIQEHLSHHLPHYMVPSILIAIENIPLTINGKLDRSALPTPEFKGEAYVAPRDDTEALLCSA